MIGLYSVGVNKKLIIKLVVKEFKDEFNGSEFCYL
jgi:hypothetical protein